MSVVVVPMTAEHVPSFREALDAVARERAYLAFLEAPPLEAVRDSVLAQLRDGWPRVVALDGERVVGWCEISSLSRPVSAHAGALVLAVVAGYRGRGIGERLLRAALGAARARGLTRVELVVREGNDAAIALYRKAGFEVEGLKRNAVRIGDVYENQVAMAILL